jgi:hypothetical protein
MRGASVGVLFVPLGLRGFRLRLVGIGGEDMQRRSDRLIGVGFVNDRFNRAQTGVDLAAGFLRFSGMFFLGITC